MKLKLDENLSRHLKQSLSAYEHDVATAADEGLLSKPDTLAAAVARNEGRMLFTLDIEFGDLRKYPPGSHAGVVLFRPRTYGPLAVNQFVEDFVRRTALEPLAGCVVIVEPARIRVRSPHIP